MPVDTGLDPAGMCAPTSKKGSAFVGLNNVQQLPRRIPHYLTFEFQSHSCAGMGRLSKQDMHKMQNTTHGIANIEKLLCNFRGAKFHNIQVIQHLHGTYNYDVNLSPVLPFYQQRDTSFEVSHISLHGRYNTRNNLLLHHLTLISLNLNTTISRAGNVQRYEYRCNRADSLHPSCSLTLLIEKTQYGKRSPSQDTNSQKSPHDPNTGYLHALWHFKSLHLQWLLATLFPVSLPSHTQDVQPIAAVVNVEHPARPPSLPDERPAGVRRV